ncbi:MAG TPA: NAD(P)H-dependent oxidoreductase [Thermoanaerobaculia bacterium]
MGRMDEWNGPIRVLGVAGSLRRGSYNRRLLAAARELAPPGMEIEAFDLDGIPLYNGDLDADGKRPAEVERLKRAIAGVDALLLVTPEYNHSVPGVLQNAIDWASRPGGKSVFVGKPVGIMGASTGAIGTARAQQQLKVVLFSTLALVLPHPGVAVGQAAEKFAPTGELIHEPTRDFVRAFLRDLRDWTLRHGRVPEAVESEAAAAQAG